MKVLRHQWTGTSGAHLTEAVVGQRPKAKSTPSSHLLLRQTAAMVLKIKVPFRVKAAGLPHPSLRKPKMRADSLGCATSASPRSKAHRRSLVNFSPLDVGTAFWARKRDWLERRGRSNYELSVYSSSTAAVAAGRNGGVVTLPRICITTKGLRRLTTGKVSEGRIPSLRGSIHGCTTRIAEM